MTLGIRKLLVVGLVAAVIVLVLTFQNSSNLANAYGIAVTGAVTIDTLLMAVLLVGVWKWKWWYAAPVVLLFLIVDGAYFAANLTKVPEGGWFPLLVGFIAFTLLVAGLDSLIPLQNTWLGMSLVASPSPPDNPVYALALPVLVMVTTWVQFKFSQPGGSDDDDKDDKKDDSKDDQADADNIRYAVHADFLRVYLALAFGWSVGLLHHIERCRDYSVQPAW